MQSKKEYPRRTYGFRRRAGAQAPADDPESSNAWTVGDNGFVAAFLFSLLPTGLPLTLLNPLAAFSLLMGTFAAGYWASRSIGQRGMLTGASCGAALFLVLLIASLQTKAQVDLTALIKLAISLLSGAIGGVTGVNRRHGSSKIKPRRKEAEK